MMIIANHQANNNLLSLLYSVLWCFGSTCLILTNFGTGTYWRYLKIKRHLRKKDLISKKIVNRKYRWYCDRAGHRMAMAEYKKKKGENNESNIDQ